LAQGVWRPEDGSGSADDPNGGVANELEKENARLRRAVSDLTLDKLILQEAAKGNFCASISIYDTPKDIRAMERYERTMARILLFNKPFGVLSQFTDRGSPTVRSTLSDFINLTGFYPAGRLDRDSEGLLLLCDDGRLQARIADPRFKLPKTYLVQVEGAPQAAALERLRQGVELKDGMTLPAEVARIDPPDLWPRNPPIRQRQSIPDSWLKLTIREGRNRQVRRMTAAPTLRLVRWSIGDWTVAGIAPGQFTMLSA
jgi:23S rRNA pseudouridine2457 synthase